MIKAYKAGVPGNGQPFPDGSKIVKLQWKPKKSAEAPFVVDLPDVFTQAFVMEKDNKKFPKSGGWGGRCSITKPGPHRPPISEGLTVTFTAEVTSVEERRVNFKVQAWDEKEKVGEGTHERAVINVARFAARVQSKFG